MEQEGLQPIWEAEGGAAGAGAGVQPAGEGTDGGAVQTFDEVLADKRYQAEFDRRVGKALETARARWNEEQQEKLQEERRLSKLSAEEKAAEKLKAAEERAQRLEAEKNAILLRQETVSQLAEKKLPGEFAGFLTGEDREQTQENLTAFEEAFRKAVEASVCERLKSAPPPAGGAAEAASGMLAVIHENQARRD